MKRIAKNALAGWAVAVVVGFWVLAYVIPSPAMSGAMTFASWLAAVFTLYRWGPSALHYLMDRDGEPQIRGDLQALIGIATLALGVMWTGTYRGLFLYYGSPVEWIGNPFSNFGHFLTAVGLFLFYRSSSVRKETLSPPNFWFVALLLGLVAAGGFVLGAYWRKDDTEFVLPVERECSPSHPIKGNTGANGERIFHVPGGRHYRATGPEVCFRSSAEARIAGYRAAR